MEEDFFRFSILAEFPEIIHGISTRRYGNMSLYRGEKEKVISNREQFFSNLGINIDQVVVAGMVHGARVAEVGASDQGRGAKSNETAIENSDGLITTDKNVFLTVTAADCLPILAYDPAIRMVGIAHAGWRGIIGGIVPELASLFQRHGGSPENLIVGIGPGICQRHFVVKKDVLDEFMDIYPETVFIRNKDGYVDLKKAVSNHFLKLGVGKNNLEVSHYCPMCNNGLFGSFRLERDAVVTSAAVIGLKED